MSAGARLAGLTLSSAICLSLAACTTSGGASPSTRATADTITPSPAGTPTATPDGSPSTPSSGATPSTSRSPSTAARTDPNAPTGQCLDTHLAVSVQDDPTGSGAGQRLAYVVFRNSGDAPCVLRGAPGVSLVRNGTQIGAAAARSTNGAAVTIAPGSFALAALSYPNIDKDGGAYGDGGGDDPQCEAEAVDGYRVYPPHSYRASFTRVANLSGCSTTLQALRVSAVAPASMYSSFTPTF